MDIDFNEYQLSSELQGHEDDVRLLISLNHICFNFSLSLFLICIWFYKLIYTHKCCQISIIVKNLCNSFIISAEIHFLSFQLLYTSSRLLIFNYELEFDSVSENSLFCDVVTRFVESVCVVMRALRPRLGTGPCGTGPRRGTSTRHRKFC